MHHDSTAPLDVTRYLADFRHYALNAGGRIEPFGEIANFPLFAWTKRAPDPRPRIYLSAGVHGDEPAPPFALLELLCAGFFDDRAHWFLCPLLNPVGFTHRTRENGNAVDLNRDYQDCVSAEVQAHVSWLQRQPPFDLALCLHEDWETHGFYLYELNPRQRPTLANAMIHAVAATMPIESEEIIDGRTIDEPGIIRPVSDPLLRANWPEAIYLRYQHTALSYTVETPSALPLAQRILAQKTAVTAAVTAFMRSYSQATG